MKKWIVRCAILSLGFPVYGFASSLDISPQLLQSESTPASNNTGAVYAPLHHPEKMNLSGYAQWKAPARTLEYVGYGNAEAASSYGHDVPLKDALRLILPSDWHIYAKSGVSGGAPVTWKAKHEVWTTPLREVLRQSGLIATINWSHQALMLRVKPVLAVKPLDTKGYTSWGGSHSLPANFHEGSAVPVSSPSLAGATPVFILNQGDLILLDLKKWANESGWKVVWQIPEDWTVPNTTTFSGNFQTAVTQVVQALANNGANIHAVFHTENNTVVISGTGSGSTS